MADNKQASNAGVSPETHALLQALVENMGKQIAEGIREGKIDPAIVARAERRREEMRKQLEQNNAERAAREARCNHMKQRGGSTAIAWYTFSDNVERGVCMHCFMEVNPEHSQYHQLRMIPRE